LYARDVYTAMARTSLVDRLVKEEYRRFEDAPLEYVADREDAVERLVADGVEESEAIDAWREFERRYIVVDAGGPTFSAHGIDRARNLGEDVRIDEEVHSRIVRVLRERDGSADFGELLDETGLGRKTLEHNLWILRRRDLVETRTEGYGDRRVASLE